MELLDYGTRRYDPQIGRFLSPDTIIPDPANLQSFNRYAYVYNNSVKYTDPSGHWEKLISCTLRLFQELNYYIVDNSSLTIFDAATKEKVVTFITEDQERQPHFSKTKGWAADSSGVYF